MKDLTDKHKENLRVEWGLTDFDEDNIKFYF